MQSFVKMALNLWYLPQCCEMFMFANNDRGVQRYWGLYHSCCHQPGVGLRERGKKREIGVVAVTCRKER
jgi:hypothetical protein